MVASDLTHYHPEVESRSLFYLLERVEVKVVTEARVSHVANFEDLVYVRILDAQVLQFFRIKLQGVKDRVLKAGFVFAQN